MINAKHNTADFIKHVSKIFTILLVVFFSSSVLGTICPLVVNGSWTQ